MVRIQACDDSAFAALMARWEIPIKRFLARMLQNEHEAADIAQDVFVRLYLKRSSYRRGARFSPWIFAIAANLARNRLRWWRRRPAVSLETWTATSPWEGASSGPDAAQALQRRELAEAVRSAVAALPVDWRASLVLCEFEGLTMADAAEALGTTAKAVESRLSRARSRLRQSLRAHQPNNRLD